MTKQKIRASRQCLRCLFCMCIAFAVIGTGRAMSQGVVINEFMSSNNGFLKDEDGDDSDWLEIYNDTDYPVLLDEYGLSDKKNSVDLWRFPDIILEARGFLLVFASGKDRRIPGKELHTNFKIDAGGEYLILSRSGRSIQRIDPTALKTNSSFGALPDGASTFVVYTAPSPGQPNTGAHYNDRVLFSTPGGVYANVFQLALSCGDSSHFIRYTLDGNEPTVASPLYTTPLRLTGELFSEAHISDLVLSPPDLHVVPAGPSRMGIVIRAAVFDEDGRRKSEVETHSYFIRQLGIDHGELPVVSLCAGYADLFSDSTGIMVPGVHWKTGDPLWTGNYFQRGNEWERDAFIEYYDTMVGRGFRQAVGVRLHGGFTRRFPQKSFALFARNDYGNDVITYPLFVERPDRNFKRLVLRSISTSTYGSGIEDHLANRFASGLDVEYLAGRPVVLYINGEYWGIYYIQEKLDEHYLETNLGVPTDSVDIMTGYDGWVEHGNGEDFSKLYAFMERADMTVAADYDTLMHWIDIDNFIDYQLLEIFIANTDWPANNTKLWRRRAEGEKWRWAFFDGDAALVPTAFDGFANALSTATQAWPTNARSTLFLRKLLMNDDIRQTFLTRLEALLNLDFSFQQSAEYFSDITLAINDEIANQIQRFGRHASHTDWLYTLGPVFDFLRFRHCEIGKQVKERFGLTMSLPPCPQATNAIAAEKVPGPKDINIYPNPNNGAFTLDLTVHGHGHALSVISDMRGRILNMANHRVNDGLNTISLSMPYLSPGGYLLHVQFKEQTFTSRLIVSGGTVYMPK